MSKQTISITRALVELKRYDARINQAISQGVFYALQKGQGTEAKVLSDTPMTVTTANEKINASFQSVDALIKNRQELKSAIVNSNATTTVEFRGENMTVASLIELKSSIKIREKYLQTLLQQRQTQNQKMNASNQALEKDINTLLNTMFGTDKKVDQQQIDMVVKSQNDKHLVSPIGATLFENKVKEIESLISDVKNELDFLLTEINSRTMIEVEI